MSRLIEYRIPLPISLEEFNLGLIYMTAKVSQEELTISDVEVIANEPFEDTTFGKGIYTHKKYHLEKSLPELLQRFFPSNSLEVDEKSWNTFPKTKTIFQVKALLASIVIEIRSIHHAGSEKLYNIHQLSDELLHQRIIKDIDIGEDMPQKEWGETISQPSAFKSIKTKRGPLKDNWIETTTPMMHAYKLVKINCNLPGTLLQSKATQLMEQFVTNAITKAHKQFFCFIDEWIELSKDQVMEYDKNASLLLNKKFHDNKKKTEKRSITQFMRSKLRAKL